MLISLYDDKDEYHHHRAIITSLSWTRNCISQQMCKRKKDMIKQIHYDWLKYKLLQKLIHFRQDKSELPLTGKKHVPFSP